MLHKGNKFCSFGPFRADLQTQELYKNAERIRIRPKAFTALIYLIENTGQVVRKSELIEHVWGGGKNRDDSDLTALIRDIRKALGDSVDEPTYLDTIPGQGYKFLIADVTYADAEGYTGQWRNSLALTSIAAVLVIALVWFLAIPSCAITIPIPLVFLVGMVVMLSTLFIAFGGRLQGRTPVTIKWTAALLLVACAFYSLTINTAVEIGYRMRPGAPWVNSSLAPQQGQFLTNFEAVPSRDHLDSVFALSDGARNEWRSFACLARLSAGGRIEAFDGDQDRYRALARVDYHKRERYWFCFAVDVPNHRYSVYVRDGRGHEYTIAKGFTFRKTQSAIRVINNFGTKMDFTSADNMLSSACVCSVRVYPF